MSTAEEFMNLYNLAKQRQDRESWLRRDFEQAERRADRPPRSDINWVIMDYLVSEGYPDAAAKFAQETNISQPFDVEAIRARVRVRSAIHAGKVDEAIDMINSIDPEVCHHSSHSHPLRNDYCFMHHSYSPRACDEIQLQHFSPQYDPQPDPHNYSMPALLGQLADMITQILDSDHPLHFNLLQLQLIEIIRVILDTPGGNPEPNAFRPALEFATEQLAPRAPTEPKYKEALERTMALMIFPMDKMPSDFKELLNPKLRESVANSVNEAILKSKGERPEAKIRQLVRARAWAEMQAREARVELPASIPIGLDGPNNNDDDAMVS